MTKTTNQRPNLIQSFGQVRATEGVECRKDAGVLDEIPYAYKRIDTVVANQTDLVDVVNTLKQIVNIKG